MQNTLPSLVDIHSRRRFLYAAAGLTTTILLAGCGSGNGGSSSGASASATSLGLSATAATTNGPELSDEASKLNLALNLEYLGAEFYAYAATGTGLSAKLLVGIGQQGAVTGGRQAAFSDQLLKQQVSEVATDKLAHVTALRGLLAASTAAQPAIDLSAGPGSAFSSVARAAGILAPGASFDAFANDANFLIGALILENVVAATYRTILPDVVTPASLQVVNANLAESIYSAGLVRSMLTAKSVDNAALAGSFAAVSTYLAKLDGSNAGDQSIGSNNGPSSNIVGADGNAVPFTRDPSQVLKAVYLTATTVRPGGFLPNGANGVSI